MKHISNIFAIALGILFALSVVVAVAYAAYMNYKRNRQAANTARVFNELIEANNEIDDNSNNIDSMPEPERGHAIRARADAILREKD